MVSNSIFTSDASIVLSMQNINHEPISQAMCQAPFILQVELKNLDGYTDVHLMQNISGLENFKSSRSVATQNVLMNNNNKQIFKTFYHFVLRSDKKGTFSVGPVQLKDKSGQTIRSNRLIVYVGDEIIPLEKQQSDKYFMTMNVDKKHAYVGEKVNLVIKFYDRLFVDNLHLKFPDFKNMYIFKSKDNDSVKKNIIKIDDEEYSVTEWSFDFYPTKSGPLILQDIYAAFFAPELESKFKLGGAFDFFMSLQKSEHDIKSEPIELNILPLPTSDKYSDIIAVGQFTKYDISINQKSVPAGQGMTLTIELCGDGNFEMIPPSQLVLPEGFKYYDSRIVTIDKKRSSKHSEFIIQADVPGNYHIESQAFHYFDPLDKQYKTLKSNDFDLVVTPALHESQIPQVLDPEEDESFQDNQSDKKELKDFNIIDSGRIHAQCIIMIPSDYYQYLLWIIFLIGLSLLVYYYGIQEYLLTHRLWKHFIIFYNAKKSCQAAVAKQDPAALRNLLRKLFAQLLEVHVSSLQDSMMIDYLHHKNFSQEQVAAWKSFYEQLLKSTFLSTNIHQEKDLYQQSFQWIEILKEKS